MEMKIFLEKKFAFKIQEFDENFAFTNQNKNLNQISGNRKIIKNQFKIVPKLNFYSSKIEFKSILNFPLFSKFAQKFFKICF
ncbi:hypothetical protein PAPYR_11885 [Paratrimastix pyriformis]|uniref:Uncharacterized protein n=1 Tax=Paratrimastix pyriformis TaxID=342808 RepID=A0ABQ8U5K3_9EUKA|nr:hypothetical protein PAPYR_11885 [Paratrimastix pyriformis]